MSMMGYPLMCRVNGRRCIGVDDERSSPQRTNEDCWQQLVRKERKVVYHRGE